MHPDTEFRYLKSAFLKVVSCYTGCGGCPLSTLCSGVLQDDAALTPDILLCPKKNIYCTFVLGWLVN